MPPNLPPPDVAVDPAEDTVLPVKQFSGAALPKTILAQVILAALGAIAFLYFARPVILPVFIACITGMTLKPLIGWLSRWHVPKSLSAAIVVCLLIAAVGIAIFQLGRPASKWINDTPKNMTELRQRVQKFIPDMGSFSEAAEAVNDLGATPEEKRADQKKSPTVQVTVKDDRGPATLLNWTGMFLIGFGETLVLLYLLLASGDLFAQKLVHVMPTFSDKRRAVRINREIQQNISHYLVSVTMINLGLGVVAGIGFYFLGVPNAVMWGLVVAVLNYVPYFGITVGVVLLATVGLLAFDTLPRALLPAGFFLLINLLEANFITPIFLGRRFSLNPVVIFVSLMFWTWLWGVTGALLSVPILASIKVVCDRFPRLSPISELLAG